MEVENSAPQHVILPDTDWDRLGDSTGELWGIIETIFICMKCEVWSVILTMYCEITLILIYTINTTNTPLKAIDT